MSEEDFRRIAGIMLGELKANLEERGIALRWEDSIVDYLVKKSYSITYGARNLRRTIQKDLEDAIAERIIDSFEHPISQMKLTATNDVVEVLAL